jgi:hypothetical protein
VLRLGEVEKLNFGNQGQIVVLNPLVETLQRL